MNEKFDRDRAPIKLYRNPLSGHCHRVELMLSFLDIPVEMIDLDMANGAHKAPGFLALNPFGQVPVIDDNGTVLSDSNAILVYLATAYDAEQIYLPKDAVGAALVQRWLSVAAGEVASGPASARLVTVFGAPIDHDTAKNKANALFEVLDKQLAQRDYLVGDTITLADIAGYSYIAHAPEGGVSLAPYSNIRSWLSRIEALPGFVPMRKAEIAAQTVQAS